MHSRLKAELETAIELWAEENSESEYWPNGIIGDFTATHMADAAAAVFDAIQEAQEYGLREGFFQEAS